MLVDHRARLKQITDFASLIGYLRDEMDWPIDGDNLEDLYFEYTAEELGIESASAAKIVEIKRLRPLSAGQPWGILFVRFEPKRLPVVALRRILSRVVLKKRASANSAERTAWEAEDLLFVSNFGEGDERQICFAHFTVDEQKTDLPTLKVLGWNHLDTMLRLDDVAELLTERLAWPDDENDTARWRERWRSAFPLRHREVITTSKLLAERLAELARAIRAQINMLLAIETEDGPLTKLMEAFREALVHDLDADGFADMYAQTIAYGLLSARIADPKANTADDFAAHMRTNPFLKELMQTFLHVGGRRKTGNGLGLDFDELGVSEVVALLDAAKMEAVLRDFGDRKPEEDPVIHFYELFLKEYDAKKRTQRGVFYTPLPVVSYIVRSVHELLQTEFGLADGLADTATWGDMAGRHPGLTLPEGVMPTDRFLTILDPATGTGTFLVEAIEVVHRTLVDRWKREGHSAKDILELWNEYVPKHLLPRLHGYELMMAPYAIAHVKIGLKLHETGYRFGSEERARIYLTNALEPAHDFSGRLEFVVPALAHEAEAVNTIKGHQRFTVVIGNPPYSLWSQNLTEAARAIVEPFRFVDGEPIKERGALQFEKILQDDYVKFFRLFQRHIDDSTCGVIGLIANHAFTDNPTLRGMRYSLLSSFPHLYCLNLHGNSSKKERSPDGSADENVFDIQQGVAVFHGLRPPVAGTEVRVCLDLWGIRHNKYKTLQNCSISKMNYIVFSATPPFFFFKARDASFEKEYNEGIALTKIFKQGSMGIVTARDHISISFDETSLIATATEFRDSQLSNDELCNKLDIPRKKGWDVGKSRELIKNDKELKQFVRDIDYRPFDSRKIFYHRSLIWGMSWPTMQHVREKSNVGLSTTRSVETGSFQHVFLSRRLIGHHFVSLKEINYLFPLWLYPREHSFAFQQNRTPNFTTEFVKALWVRFGLRQAGIDGLPHELTLEQILHYTYAVLHSPRYRSRYAEFLKIDFPRLPLTSILQLFRELARLGAELVALHLVESTVQQAVTAGYDKTEQAWRYEVVRNLGLPITLMFEGPENPVVGKVGWCDDTVWIDPVRPKKSAAEGSVTGTVGFHGVPEAVWNFHIGGYQVCEKWLKDRRGRTLTAEDITHYHRIVIALHETIRIMREIDEVIDAHGGWPGAFQPAGAAGSEMTEAPPEQPELVSAHPIR